MRRLAGALRHGVRLKKRFCVGLKIELELHPEAQSGIGLA